MARLLVDGMLGRLARYLRFCGHDAAYAPDRGVEDDGAIAALARREGRTVVTRDRSICGDGLDVWHLEATDIDGQLREVAAAGLDLTPTERPRRCGRCNGRLRPGATAEDLPEYVPEGATALSRCRRCGRYFWRGSHWTRVSGRLERARSDD
ncbi:MAG: Mut7-C RNAse domain-containing protein [Halobacteriales archaeon]